jgi:hypothetical protein
MIENIVSTTAGDLVIGRDTDSRNLIIACIDGIIIEVRPGGQISVDLDGEQSYLRGLNFLQPVTDCLPPYFSGPEA